jgi:hypothetical protein
MKYTQKRMISYAEVSQKYNSLIDLAQTEYSLHELAGNVIQTVSILTNNTISKKNKKHMLLVKEHDDPMKQTIVYKVIETFEDFVIFTSIYEEVNTLWNNLLVSLSLGIPFATNKILELASPPKFLKANQHEIYLMCQIALKDEIGYVPVIESISDVLRLRENKYVSNFRETLWRWSKALKHGEKSDIEKIKKEIRIANKDLRRLEKWQYADNWIFWVEIAASLVPALNYVVVGEAIVRRLFMNKLESRSGWLAFIRE